MARDGSGNYTAPLSDVVVDTTILASWANTTIGDIATALTASIAKDGQTNPTANLPMNTFRHTGVGAPANRTDYARVGELVDGVWSRLTSIGGTADVVTAVGPYGLAAYVAGQRFSFVSGGAANTGAVTININSIGAKAITKNGTTPLDADDLPAGQLNMIEYDGTQFQLLVPGFYAGDYTPVADVGISFSSGDQLLFVGTLPSGWSRESIDNEAVRLDSSVTPGDGGTVNFDDAFTDLTVSGNVGNTTLTIAQMPSHHHDPLVGTAFNVVNGTAGTAHDNSGSAAYHTQASRTDTEGGGGSHTHTLNVPIDIAVKFRGMNMISKD